MLDILDGWFVIPDRVLRGEDAGWTSRFLKLHLQQTGAAAGSLARPNGQHGRLHRPKESPKDRSWLVS